MLKIPSKSKFTKDDFKCRCGCGEGKLDARLLLFLLDLEEQGLAFKLNGPYRCKKHNAETAGSSPTSNHCLGRAVDIGFDRENYELSSEIAFTLSDYGLRHLDYEWGMHVDCGKSDTLCFDLMPLM